MGKKLFYYITIFSPSFCVQKFLSCHGNLDCQIDAFPSDVETPWTKFWNSILIPKCSRKELKIISTIAAVRCQPSFMTLLIIIPSIVFTMIRNEFFSIWQNSSYRKKFHFSFFATKSFSCARDNWCFFLSRGRNWGRQCVNEIVFWCVFHSCLTF